MSLDMRSLVFFVALVMALPASAGQGPDCPCDADRVKLEAFRDRIAESETPEQARDLALRKVRLGHMAIRRASRLLPASSELEDAEARLSAFEASIEGSASQAEVAGQFDLLMDQRDGAVRCHYTTVEVVIIVVGFVFGILPGILFLFLFC